MAAGNHKEVYLRNGHTNHFFEGKYQLDNLYYNVITLKTVPLPLQ